MFRYLKMLDVKEAVEVAVSKLSTDSASHRTDISTVHKLSGTLLSAVSLQPTTQYRVHTIVMSNIPASSHHVSDRRGKSRESCNCQPTNGQASQQESTPVPPPSSLAVRRSRNPANSLFRDYISSLRSLRLCRLEAHETQDLASRHTSLAPVHQVSTRGGYEHAKCQTLLVYQDE